MNFHKQLQQSLHSSGSSFTSEDQTSGLGFQNKVNCKITLLLALKCSINAPSFLKRFSVYTKCNFKFRQSSVNKNLTTVIMYLNFTLKAKSTYVRSV